MDEEFHRSEKLTKEKMESLLSKSNHPAIVRFLIMYTLFIAASALLVSSWEWAWWKFLPALFGFAIMGCSLFACEHETVHNTAFRSRRLNRIAAFLCGIGHWYAPTAFRDLHFTHHRYTHEIGKDPEISLGSKPVPSVIASIPSYLGWLSGLPLLIFKIFMLLFGAIGMPTPIQKQFFPFIRNESKIQLAFESILILAVHTGILLLAIFINPGFWGLFIGQALSHCLLAGYLIMEHNGLPHKGNIMQKTRSIKINTFVKLLMWNMPYHAEHHAYPGIPFHALPKLHNEILDELINKDEDHLSFHLKVIRGK